MFRKKVIATATTAALVTGMFAGTAMAAEWNENGGSQTVEGVSTAVQPTISVELPGDLAFGINPLKLDADEDQKADGQIVATSYGIVNYSNVPVLVNAKTSATAGTGVNLKTSIEYNSDTNELKPTADTDKDVFLLQVFPASASGVSYSDDTGVTIKGNTITKAATGGVKDETTAQAAGALVLSGTANSVDFKLAAFENDTVKATNASGFTFDGVVNPNATFADGDVTVSTVFTLSVISQKQYDGGYDKPAKTFGDTGKAKVDVSVVEKK